MRSQQLLSRLIERMRAVPQPIIAAVQVGEEQAAPAGHAGGRRGLQGAVAAGRLAVQQPASGVRAWCCLPFPSFCKPGNMFLRHPEVHCTHCTPTCILPYLKLALLLPVLVPLLTHSARVPRREGGLPWPWPRMCGWPPATHASALPLCGWASQAPTWVIPFCFDLPMPCPCRALPMPCPVVRTGLLELAIYPCATCLAHTNVSSSGL